MAAELGARSARIGVDVGGTFTDVLLLDDATGDYRVAKVLTTAANPARGVLEGVDACLAAAGAPAGAARRVVHGTTLVTNTIIERRGAPTALLTTRGFKDVLDIAREHRHDMYDILLEQPRALAPRERRFEVGERVLADGAVYRPLDLETVDAAAEEIARLDIGSVAVVFLHAYRNPSHEERTRERLRERLPDLRVSLSSEVAGEIREYERASTTLANAYVQAVLDTYLREVEEGLDRRDAGGRLLIMLSNGGVATPETARSFPVRLIESGPAAGALAAAHRGRQCGRPDLLSFDMGGTTAKACLIEGGRPSTVTAFEVARVDRFKPGSGLPILAPTIDLIEVGAGGGSIARVDQLGLVRVGPESAGASPGPACYGLGGDLPTVTDADLILGYLDPEYFLGGRMPLDRAAAELAIERHVARPLGLPLPAAAWAIHRTVDETMAAAARVHAVERGKDVRRFPLFAFGGAGPVHACDVAGILRLGEVVAPFAAGVGSTIGFLVAPLAFDFVRGHAGLLDRLDWEAVDGLCAEMEGRGRELLAEAGVGPEDVAVERSCDMRLSGQAHQIAVPVPSGRLTATSAEAVRAAFEETYRRLFQRAAPGVPAEVLNWRVRLEGPQPEARPFRPGGRADAAAAIKGRRAIYVPERSGYETVQVYDRYLLGPGARFAGPAIVEERESTVVVGAGAAATVDAWSNLIIELGKE